MVIPEGMLAHIRHAERWLRRARSDCGRGEARQAVLRLLLAEAEIRRARESGEDAHPSFGPRRSSWTVVGAVAAAGVIAAAYALAGLFATSPAVPRVIRGLPAAQRPNSIVRFESGRVLPLVGPPAGVGSDGRTLPGFVWSSEDPLLSGDGSPELVTFR